LNFKNIFEIVAGYKSIDYAYVMFMLKLKIDIGYAPDFGVGDNFTIIFIIVIQLIFDISSKLKESSSNVSI